MKKIHPESFDSITRNGVEFSALSVSPPGETELAKHLLLSWTRQ